jgi:uncharacterized coiled-coil protein SlyX
MKLAVIARVNGGLDIIETFVRHHVQHFDKLIILNNGTSDDTYQVLHQLQRVYSDLVVLRQPTIGYRQHQYMLLLLRMAVDKFGADWVAFIDADEFIETADGLVLTQVLAGRQPTVYRLEWSNCVYAPDLVKDERTWVLRQRFRLPSRPEVAKLLIHAQFITRTTELGVGNHSLMDGDRPVSTQPLDQVRLCHYAVRSVAQYERASTEILLLQDRLSQLQRELAASQEKVGKQAEQLSELNNRLATSQQTGENLAKQLSQLQIEFVDSQHRVDKQTQQLSHLQNQLLSSQEKIASQARQLQSRTFRILTRVHGILIRAKIVRQRW